MSLWQLLRNNTIRNSLFRQVRFSSNCWSCGKDVKTLVSNLFCSNCKALQSPSSKENYFQIMGVKETYDLDENDLSSRYKELQKYLHPDKYANRLVAYL